MIIGAATDRPERIGRVGFKGMSPFLSWLWGEAAGFSNLLKLPFAAAAWLYGLAVALRLRFYRWGLLSKKRVDCRIVSIGNLTTGGTGKTPMVLYFAEQWRAQGLRVGIVSRGYRRENKDPVALVSDGAQILETAASVGDEPHLLARRLRNIPVAVGADRYRVCRWLRSRFDLEVILLDDGFQHLSLHRDLNLLVVDATCPFGNGHLLPRGALREPIAQIARADWVILTRADDEIDLDNTMRTIAPFGVPVLRSCFVPTALVHLKTGTEDTPSALAGQGVLPVCGVGNPDAFLNQVLALGARLETPLLFQDHHRYGRADLDRIARTADAVRADWIMTTEKDAVKIKAIDPIDPRMYALRIGPVFKDDAGPLLSGLFET